MCVSVVSQNDAAPFERLRSEILVELCVADHVHNVSHNGTRFHLDLFPGNHVKTGLWPGQGIAVAIKCHGELQAITVASEEHVQCIV